MIGSGPSGLAVADMLNSRGHDVTVYERSDRPGGLLMYGIPNMKLEKEVIDRKIAYMEKRGIRFILNTEVATGKSTAKSPYPKDDQITGYLKNPNQKYVKAEDLLKEYDMLATSGRDYHFYITDASGDGRVVEYDCETPDRKLVATPSVAVTNFFIKYEEKVLPNQRNGIYGHGRERYDRIMTVLEESQGNQTKETTWDALKTAAQEPNPEEVTSNTQWSIVYNNTDRTAEIALRRKWEDTTEFTVLGMWKE